MGRYAEPPRRNHRWSLDGSVAGTSNRCVLLVCFMCVPKAEWVVAEQEIDGFPRRGRDDRFGTARHIWARGPEARVLAFYSR